jgi:tetratricopeptide (TPR) repeat protein
LILIAPPILGQDNRWDEAGKAYDEKNYDQAIALYESILKDGYESAPLYFNLGDAYFKNGDLGHAVLNFYRARRLDPTDPDIAHNLEFAQRFSSVQMEGVELNPIGTFLSGIVDSYRLNTLAWISSFFFIATIILLALRFGLGFKNAALKGGLTIGIILLVISTGLTSYKYRIDYLVPRAVIVAEDAEVRSGPTDQSDLELTGAPGLIVEILSENSGYYNVLFENKRRGWIAKDQVEVI